VAAILAVARRRSTSFVLGWRLRALHVDQLLVDGESGRDGGKASCGRGATPANDHARGAYAGAGWAVWDQAVASS
jgi:hypothetical protein